MSRSVYQQLSVQQCDSGPARCGLTLRINAATPSRELRNIWGTGRLVCYFRVEREGEGEIRDGDPYENPPILLSCCLISTRPGLSA